MKITILSSLLVLGGLNVNAQETESALATPKYAIKVYNSFGYQRMNTSNGIGPGSNTRSKEITLLKPSIAFMWQDKRGNSREIELSSFSLNRKDEMTRAGNITLGGMRMTTTDISLRIEKITNFAKKKDWKLKPSLGFGLNPYVMLENYVPKISATYPRSEQHYGVRAYIAPRLNYNVSKRVFIDLNIPLTVATMEYEYQKEQNPIIVGDEGYGVTNFNTFPMQVAARLGLGIRL